MIKAKQIPKEVENALMQSLIFSGQDGAEALASALNAWPGRFSGNAWPDLAPTIVLPLSHEDNDD